MILYNTRSFGGYGQYFHLYGSAIFSLRSLPQALIGGFLGWYATQDPEYWRQQITNPTAYFSGISLTLGFLLVFRSQLAYGRYWEGRTHVQVLVSKLEDVAIHTKTFVRTTDKESLEWKANMAVMLVNFIALAVADLRKEADLDYIVVKYGVVLTKLQKSKLQAFHYRTYLQMCWIVDEWVKRSVEGGVSVSPPVQSRTYQIISEAQLAFNGAQKIQSTPFPFPLVQVCGMLLHLYMLSAPLVIGAYIQTPALGTMLATLSVLGLFALNKTAEELEDPFGVDPNDLPLDGILAEFRNSIFALELLDKTTFMDTWSNLQHTTSMRDLQDKPDVLAASKSLRNMHPRLMSNLSGKLSVSLSGGPGLSAAAVELEEYRNNRTSMEEKGRVEASQRSEERLEADQDHMFLPHSAESSAGALSSDSGVVSPPPHIALHSPAASSAPAATATPYDAHVLPLAGSRLLAPHTSLRERERVVSRAPPSRSMGVSIPTDNGKRPKVHGGSAASPGASGSSLPPMSPQEIHEAETATPNPLAFVQGSEGSTEKMHSKSRRDRLSHGSPPARVGDGAERTASLPASQSFSQHVPRRVEGDGSLSVGLPTKRAGSSQSPSHTKSPNRERATSIGKSFQQFGNRMSDMVMGSERPSEDRLAADRKLATGQSTFAHLR
mmetsp:Transcript_31765/g.61195  ORF Transcript_31765/g.61195 Transcript_31765/m.61195 type:complete len:664 (+) Transcript_31765:248-2239(+)